MTIEELHELYDGKDGPVWVLIRGDNEIGTVWPAILDIVNNQIVAVWAFPEEEALFEKDYGVEWVAYRTREEAEKASEEGWASICPNAKEG